MDIETAIREILSKDFRETLSTQVVIPETGSNKITEVRLANDKYFRVSSDPRRVPACYREKFALKKIEQEAPDLPVPRILSSGRINGYTYNVLSKLEGEPAPIAKPDSYDFGRQLAEFYIRLHQIVAYGCGYPDLDGSMFNGSWKEFVHQRIIESYRKAKNSLGARIRRKIMHLFECTPLDNRPIRLLHHDPNPRNYLVKNGILSGVVDWETSIGGDPESDYAFLLDRNSEAFQEGVLDIIRSTGQVNGYFTERSLLYAATDRLCQLDRFSEDSPLRQKLLGEIEEVLKPVRPGLKHQIFPLRYLEYD